MRSMSTREDQGRLSAAAGRAVAAAAALVVAGAVLFGPAVPSSAQEPPSERVYVVDTTSDRVDASPDDGVCRTVEGTCSLRAAVREANDDGQPSRITFAIPGPGPHVIRLSNRLQVLTAAEPVVIDGYTQPGAAPNDAEVGSNARLLVQLQGSGPDGHGALFINSAGNEVRGLAFFDFSTSIRLHGSGATGNAIVGNFIGTDVAGAHGAAARHTAASGVVIERGASHNVIGRPVPADRNVISGNAQNGVALYDGGTRHNLVQNNVIGLHPSGTSALPNQGHGVDVNSSASYNLIGGSGAFEANVLSGNVGHGAEVSHGTSTVENRVIGNLVGTDATGEAAPAFARNGDAGIRVEDRPIDTEVAHNVIGGNAAGGVLVDHFSVGTRIHHNHIGVSPSGRSIANQYFGVHLRDGATGSVVGPGNVIAGSRSGVRIADATSTGNTVTQNSIRAVSGLGIDIAPFGQVTPDGTGGPDGMANNGQGFPVITATSADTVAGTACAGCTVEVFQSTHGPGSHGSGTTLLGHGVADQAGAFSIPVEPVWPDRNVTATATSPAGDSSEFGPNHVLTGLASSPPDGVVAVEDGFDRSVGAGWGDAPVGGAWSWRGALEPDSFSVDGGHGRIVVPAAGGSRGMYLPDLAVGDVEVAVAVSSQQETTAFGQMLFAAARVSPDGEYRARLRFDAQGSVHLILSKLVGRFETPVSPEVALDGLAHQIDRPFRLVLRATGESPTHLAAKAWPHGETEPPEWQLQTTDRQAELQAPGGIGVRGYVASAATTVPVEYRFGDITARSFDTAPLVSVAAPA